MILKVRILFVCFLGEFEVTDAGMKLLSKLLYLEELSLGTYLNITGRTLKYFKKLKEVQFMGCDSFMIKYLCKMIRNCNELERMVIVESLGNRLDDFLESIAKVLLLRTTDIPLTLHLSLEYQVRMSPFKSEDKTNKLFFELSKNDRRRNIDDFKTSYSSYDIDLVLQKIRRP